ncbi:MAG TPA: HisA/HisF-related TIM barrel protein [Candidatus Deferrimicrobium sp.]|nr:HisA/HisF-related TIM barrel protein [Candidatus Deferrimicrobium sp.]
MLVIPSLDLQKGRSRLVWWPGASTGVGAPTDRPAVIAEALVAQGAPAIHLVDLDGAQQGRPVNLEAIGGVARAVAKPLQVAGGVDGPEQIEMAFAAGATRVVLPLWAVVEDRPRLASCLDIAGDWLAVGLDARPESLSGYPWRHRSPPRLGELVLELGAAGVRRFIFSHLPTEGAPQLMASLTGGLDADVLVAGGTVSLDALRGLREAGVAGVILGEALFTGRLDLGEALRAAA